MSSLACLISSPTAISTSVCNHHAHAYHYPFALQLNIVLSKQDRFDKGKDFQEHIKKLLLRGGYLEGQVYSTGGTFYEDYYEQLKKLGKLSYTSPDILILNNWDKLMEKHLDKRFGIACANRDAKFDNFGTPSVTFPRYQQHKHAEIEEELGMPMYIIFGRQIESHYGIGVTELKAPDDVRYLPEQSTGGKRWNDIFYIERLWTWRQFIEHRHKMGDREPEIDKADAPEFPCE